MRKYVDAYIPLLIALAILRFGLDRAITFGVVVLVCLGVMTCAIINRAASSRARHI